VLTAAHPAGHTIHGDPDDPALCLHVNPSPRLLTADSFRKYPLSSWLIRLVHTPIVSS
jgi:hypothetical protein